MIIQVNRLHIDSPETVVRTNHSQASYARSYAKPRRYAAEGNRKNRRRQTYRRAAVPAAGKR